MSRRKTLVATRAPALRHMRTAARRTRPSGLRGRASRVAAVRDGVSTTGLAYNRWAFRSCGHSDDGSGPPGPACHELALSGAKGAVQNAAYGRHYIRMAPRFGPRGPARRVSAINRRTEAQHAHGQQQVRPSHRKRAEWRGPSMADSSARHRTTAASCF